MRLPSRLSARLLAFNLLLVFLPAAGLLYLDVYERQLLAAQERSMVQQGRLLAAALGGREGEPELSAERARDLLTRLAGRTEARLRVVGPTGALLADSALLGPAAAPRLDPRRIDYRREAAAISAGASAVSAARDARKELLYRLGAGVYRVYQRLTGSGPGSGAESFYRPGRPLLGPEVRAALAGRYGAATRHTGGQRSLTLYVAIPVRGTANEVTGAVLVSQSTLRILSALVEVRLGAWKVVLASVLAAALLSLLVAATIARPLARLRAEAQALVDRRGRLRGSFRGSARRDEIGDLARALEELTRRLEAHLRFTEGFAADVSHELKNPLAAVRSATELLAEVEEPRERDRFVALVLGEVARMERLLSSVREVTVIDARLGEEPTERVDLAALLADVTAAAALGAPRGVRIELRPAEGPLPVLASPERLTQVFGNLLDNAIDFSPDGAEVTVTAGTRGSVELAGGPGSAAGGPEAGRAALAVGDSGSAWRPESAGAVPIGPTAVVTVEDRGPGIPESQRERVFDRFFSDRRAAPGRAGRPDRGHRDEHSGLGLAIARAIVEGYGGSLVAAGRPGGGARLVLRLPLAG